MKKYLILIYIIVLSFLSGCKLFEVEIVECDGSITLTCDEDLLPYLPYKDFPTYTLTFEGKINITKQRQGEFECIFTKNDDFTISSLVKKTIETYASLDRVSYALISTDNENEVWMNRRDDIADEKEYIKVKDGKVYNELAYITLESGLQLSFNYARFVDENNITYYRWQKTESIRMVLHYPFMVTKINDEKNILFLALPNGVRYSLSTTTKRLDKIIEDDKFITDNAYYTFEYPNGYAADYQNFYDYYCDNFNGRLIGEDFVHTFLSYDFKITFNEDNFVIERY